MVDVGAEQVVEAVFVNAWIFGLSAAFLYFTAEVDHLIDGLLACEAVYEFGDNCFEVCFGFASF